MQGANAGTTNYNIADYGRNYDTMGAAGSNPRNPRDSDTMDGRRNSISDGRTTYNTLKYSVHYELPTHSKARV